MAPLCVSGSYFSSWSLQLEILPSVGSVTRPHVHRLFQPQHVLSPPECRVSCKLWNWRGSLGDEDVNNSGIFGGKGKRGRKASHLLFLCHPISVLFTSKGGGITSVLNKGKPGADRGNVAGTVQQKRHKKFLSFLSLVLFSLPCFSVNFLSRPDMGLLGFWSTKVNWWRARSLFCSPSLVLKDHFSRLTGLFVCLTCLWIVKHRSVF